MNCSKCGRRNPTTARFCWFDGVPLNGTSATPAGVTDAARASFVSPFLFPTGRACRNFEELALGCQENWAMAADLLRKGHFEEFLKKNGRGDLALAAQEAVRMPDANRGLDHFLSRIPSRVLSEPKLRVEPDSLNFRNLPIGQDRVFQVYLKNEGKRLLYGWIGSQDGWLTIGEGAGAQAKMFQFAAEQSVPVRIVGKLLRAGAKPLDGKLVVESNGGTVTVPLTVTIPVQPFPKGVLAGAMTPRELAKKAKANTPAAIPLFENGTVAQWYEANGWTYPVLGQAAYGVAAVQQFFEAVGLVKTPQVELSEEAIRLRGRVGAKIEYSLAVITQENRAAIAFGSSNQNWLHVGPTIFRGRSAFLPLTVAAVAGRPGETLHAVVSITANGCQRFTVPVTLSIAASELGPPPVPAPPRQQPVSVAATPVPANPELVALPVAIPVVASSRVEAIAVAASPRTDAIAVAASPHDDAIPLATSSRVRAPAAVAPGGRGRRGWVYALAIIFLLLGFLGAVAHDLLLKPEEDSSYAVAPLLDTNPRIAVHFHEHNVNVKIGPTGLKPAEGEVDMNRIPAVWEPSMRFGVTMVGQPDPTGASPNKRLTYAPGGLTNNTCVRLDGNEWLFGDSPLRLEDGRQQGTSAGRWQEMKSDLGTDPATGLKIEGCKSVWIYDAQKIVITQTVAIVPGDQSRLLDTCLIRYQIDNQDKQPHRVGLRMLLDTFIGANDGVPFTLPGMTQLCDTEMEFNRAADIPDFIEALEHPDLRNPGTIAHLALKRTPPFDPPDRLTLGAWPNFRLHNQNPACLQEKTLWDVPVLPIKTLTPADSAVTIYWNERGLLPGKQREMAFTYGLGNVSSGEAEGKLGVSVGGAFVEDGEFTVTAYVNHPAANERVTLDLPEGFQLLAGTAEQMVPLPPPGAASANSPVTWKVRASSKAGQYALKIRASSGVAQSQSIIIRHHGSIFN